MNAHPGTSDFRVTLLGTGHPYPSPERFGPSTLIEAGGQRLLVDAGRGATIRLWQLNIPLSAIDRLLLTHFHSDHTNGVPDLWLTGWLPPPWAARKTAFQVIGPTGAKRLMAGLEQAYAADIAIRVADEQVPRSGIAVEVQEFDRDGVIYEKDGLKVTAFEVDHGARVVELAVVIILDDPCLLSRCPVDQRETTIQCQLRSSWELVGRRQRNSLCFAQIVHDVFDHDTLTINTGRNALKTRSVERLARAIIPQVTACDVIEPSEMFLGFSYDGLEDAARLPDWRMIRSGSRMDTCDWYDQSMSPKSAPRFWDNGLHQISGRFLVLCQGRCRD